KKFLEQMSMEGFRVSDIMFQKNMVEKEHPTVTLTISSETNFNHDSLLKYLMEFEYIDYASEA
ncbi:MAG: hypothetical protein K6G40_03975, partial [Eubacterium sp.]|nr:hypothetical protein [Eubacterium sp.]